MSAVADMREANSFDHATDTERRTRVVARLRALVGRALAASPFYLRDRSVLEALMTEHDETKFLRLYRDVTPLTKAELSNSFDRLITDRTLSMERCASFDASHSAGDEVLEAGDGGAVQVIKTSGTSGTVVYVVDRVANIRRVMASVLFRALFRYAYRTGLLAYFIPFARPVLRMFRRSTSGAKRRRRSLSFGERLGRIFRPAVLVFVHRGNRSVYRGTTKHSQPWFVRPLAHVELVSHETSLETILDRTEEIDPEFVFGLPSRLEWLARAQLRGELAIDPLAIYVGGETLRADLIALFHDAWPSAHVVNTYGATETKVIGIACPECRELHLLEDVVHLELYRDDGTETGVGETATHVYATSLRNELLPVLRYTMTDRIVPLADAGCRIRTRRIRVEGREPAFVWAKRTSGEWVPLNGRMLKERLVAIPGSSGFLLEYRELGSLRLRLVSNDDASAIEASAREALATWSSEQGGTLAEYFPHLGVEVVTTETWNRLGGKLDTILSSVVPDTLADAGDEPEDEGDVR